MADLIQLQYHLNEAAKEMETLPVEHWECWIIQLVSDLDKAAKSQGQKKAFRNMLTMVTEDISNYLE